MQINVRGIKGYHVKVSGTKNGWPIWCMVITNGEYVTAASKLIQEVRDWDWVAFLIYAKAKGWEIEEI